VLLLDVRVQIDPKLEDALNEWYYTHVPRLVSIPGYESGRRYVALTSGPKYSALYEIPDESFLPKLLGADADSRHPLTLAEWAEWDRRFVPYMVHGSTNLYEADDGFPLLAGDHPIVQARFDAAGAAEAGLGRHLLQLAERLEGVVKASLLAVAGDTEVGWLGSKPSHQLLLQMENHKAAVDLVETGLFDELGRGRGTEVETVAYAQIARHWPYTKKE
jgi:hypothetical protein